MQEQRTCDNCGAPVERSAKSSAGEWERRRFCSRTCIATTTSSWNAPRVALLKEFWADGLSASQIVGRLGGITRSAVIGKIHRLGLSGRATTAKQAKGQAARNRAQRSKKHAWNPATTLAAQKALTAESLAEYQALRSKPDLDIPKHERKTILVERNGRLHANDKLDSRSCRWPLNEGDPVYEFCGRETVALGISYCPFHLARVANPPALAGRLFKAETKAWHEGQAAKERETA